MIEKCELHRSNRKSICIIIDERANVVVRAPKDASLEEIDKFLEEKKNWIEKKQKKVLKVLEENEDLLSYHSILFFGKKFSIIETKGLKEFNLQNDYLEIPKYKLKERREVLKEWLIEKTEEVIFPRVKYFADLMELNYTSVKIFSSICKWGMCDYLGNIYINYKCMMLPPYLIDYVIIHELAHLIELNHGERFWKIVESIMPNYKDNLIKLKDAGFIIKL